MLQRVKVERMAPEGEAIARSEETNKIVFVPHGVPGDRLEVETVETKGTFSRARIRSVLAPGPDRVPPPCPLHFDPSRRGPACGGCDWQQMSYPVQLRHKREIVLDCLSRIGKIRGAEVGETLASPRDWRYRNKVQIPFGEGPQGVIAGFYAVGSHRIVDFDDCPVQPELSVKIALKVKELARRWRWPVYEEGRGWLRHLFVRSNERGQALAALVSKSPEFPKQAEFVEEMRRSFPELIGLHQNVQPLKSSVVLGPSWRKLWGADRIEERIGKLSFMVSPGAFLQVNTGAAEILYETALKAATSEGVPGADLIDLYCGVGTIGLFMAQAFHRVTGIEENREAVQDAWKNAERNSIKNARFLVGSAESALPRALKETAGRAIVVVDPPRAGCSPQVLRALGAAGLKRLVYVSCNPATFARDAGQLLRAGYSLDGVQPVDLFPQTSHVELVGLFDRK